MSVFVHSQGIKTVHAGGGDQKMEKFCPRSCRMTPNRALDPVNHSLGSKNYINF